VTNTEPAEIEASTAQTNSMLQRILDAVESDTSARESHLRCEQN